MAAGTSTRDPGSPRSWIQRTLIALNSLLLVAALATAGWGGYVYSRVRDIDSVDLDAVLRRGGDEPTREAGEEGHEGTQEATEEERPPSEPLNFLLVGSDSREFIESGEDADSFGAVDSPPRADTILLARVDPVAKTAALVSFPRDLYIDIAGEEGRNRINTAFGTGPGALIQTISENFGVSIDHYVQVDFEGFRELIDAIGGIELWISHPVRDWGRPAPGERLRNISGLDISATGCVLLDGGQALSYVRSRHFEQLIDGRWRPDPTGDLGRIERQQDLVVRAVAKALSEGLLNPVKLLRIIDAVDGHLFTDDNLDPGEAVDLASQLDGLDAQTIRRDTIPTETFITPAGANVQVISDEAEVERIMQVFRGEEPEVPVLPPPGAAHPVPAQISLTVVNGTGRGGEALAGRQGFEAAGFGVTGTDDRPPFDTAVTTVEHGPGLAPHAAVVARYLPATATVVEVPEEGITVVTGADFTGVSSVPRPQAVAPATPPPTTTTTLSEAENLMRFYTGVGSSECYAG